MIWMRYISAVNLGFILLQSFEYQSCWNLFCFWMIRFGCVTLYLLNHDDSFSLLHDACVEVIFRCLSMKMSTLTKKMKYNQNRCFQINKNWFFHCITGWVKYILAKCSDLALYKFKFYGSKCSYSMNDIYPTVDLSGKQGIRIWEHMV